MVGRAAAGPRVRARQRLRRRLGRRPRPDPHPRHRRRRRGRDRDHGRRGPLPRPALPAGARHDDPRGAALRAGQLARGRRGPQLPQVLRRQHPRRRTRGGPRGLRRDPRGDPPLVRRGSRRRAARRPPRRPARPPALPRGPRRPHRWCVRPGGEDPRAGGGAAERLGDLGHHRLRRAGLRRPGADRPRRRGAAHRAGGPTARSARGLAPDGARQQAGRRRRDPALGGPADHPRAEPRDR